MDIESAEATLVIAASRDITQISSIATHLGSVFENIINTSISESENPNYFWRLEVTIEVRNSSLDNQLPKIVGYVLDLLVTPEGFSLELDTPSFE